MTNHKHNQQELEIIVGMAHCVWALSWADEQDRTAEGVSLSGMDVYEVAPNTPFEAERLAYFVARKIEALNRRTLSSYFEAIGGDDAEGFGCDLMLACLGNDSGILYKLEENNIDMQRPSIEQPDYLELLDEGNEA